MCKKSFCSNKFICVNEYKYFNIQSIFIFPCKCFFHKRKCHIPFLFQQMFYSLDKYVNLYYSLTFYCFCFNIMKDFLFQIQNLFFVQMSRYVYLSSYLMDHLIVFYFKNIYEKLSIVYASIVCFALSCIKNV